MTQSSNESNPSPYPKWHNVAAGAAAGAGARLLTAPLDLLKIRRQLASSSTTASTSTTGVKSLFSNLNIFQSFQRIVQTEGGISSLFRGNVAATYLWIGYAAVQFTLYARTSDFLTQFHLQQSMTTGTTTNLSPPVMLPTNIANHNHHSTSTSDFYHHDTISRTKSSTSELLHSVFHTPTTILSNTLHHIGSNPTLVAFCSGATAGTCATILTYPFDFCRTAFATQGEYIQRSLLQQQQQQSSTTTTNIIRTVPNFFSQSIQRNGIMKGLFSGVNPAIIQIIPYMGINFALYDYLIRSNNDKNVMSAGIAGTIAGGCSKLLVYPLDTVKKRLQAQTFCHYWGSSEGSTTTATKIMNGSCGAIRKDYKSMMDCIVRISREEGITAFYRGLVPTVLKSMVGTGVTFAVFTFTKNTLEHFHDRYHSNEISNGSSATTMTNTAQKTVNE